MNALCRKGAGSHNRHQADNIVPVTAAARLQNGPLPPLRRQYDTRQSSETVS